MKFTARWIRFRSSRHIGGEQTQVRSQLGDMAQGFAIGRTQVEQRTSRRRARNKPRPGVKPGSVTKMIPVHKSGLPTVRLSEEAGIKPRAAIFIETATV